MTGCRVGFLLAITVVGFLAQHAHSGDGMEDVVGAIWKYRLSQRKKEKIGQFRVYQNEIFKGDDKIGVVKPKDSDESMIILTDYKEVQRQSPFEENREEASKVAGEFRMRRRDDLENDRHTDR